jgi:hypothetical protein
MVLLRLSVRRTDGRKLGRALVRNGHYRPQALEIDYGDTIAETASFLCRDETRVRVKMKELGLVERPNGAGRLKLSLS